jgi:hypothetical protein
MARKESVAVGFSAIRLPTDAQFELTAGKPSIPCSYAAVWWRIDQSTVVVIAGTAPNECIIEKGED